MSLCFWTAIWIQSIYTTAFYHHIHSWPHRHSQSCKKTADEWRLIWVVVLITWPNEERMGSLRCCCSARSTHPTPLSKALLVNRFLSLCVRGRGVEAICFHLQKQLVCWICDSLSRSSVLLLGRFGTTWVIDIKWHISVKLNACALKGLVEEILGVRDICEGLLIVCIDFSKRDGETRYCNVWMVIGDLRVFTI